MAKQTINIGTTANDGTGDPIRAAFGKVNDNFTEIYTANTGVNTGDQNLSAYATTAAVAAGYQPLDSDLTAISALTTTAYGRALLSTADAATLRSAIGVGTTDAPTFLGVNGPATKGAINLSVGGAYAELLYNSVSMVQWSQNTVNLNSPSIRLGSNVNAFLAVDTVNIIEQRNGTSAQAFRVYNSTDATPATNYDRAVFDFKTTTNTLRIGTENGGTYTLARQIDFVTGGVVRMQMAADGSLYHLGNMVISGVLNVAAASYIGLSGRMSINSSTSGVIRLNNGTATGFTRLELGEADMGIMRGTGFPEGVVTGKIGSLYLRLDGGAGTTLYVKESGAGTSTGWVAK